MNIYLAASNTFFSHYPKENAAIKSTRLTVLSAPSGFQRCTVSGNRKFSPCIELQRGKVTRAIPAVS